MYIFKPFSFTIYLSLLLIFIIYIYFELFIRFQKCLNSSLDLKRVNHFVLKQKVFHCLS